MIHDIKGYTNFLKFYNSIGNKENIFYIFFSHGMLLWLKKMKEFIPQSLNTVYIAAAMNHYEKSWINEHINCPVFFAESLNSDQQIWNWLILANEKDFGWIDIDCYVFNPKLFLEITHYQSDCIFNCFWSSNTNRNYIMPHTFFVYININAIKAVRKAFPGLLPCIYSYGPDSENSIQISSEYAHNIQTLVPIGEYLVPEDASNSLPFFDTLYFFTLHSILLGYKVNSIRSLPLISYEAAHIGNSSYFTNNLQSIAKFNYENTNKLLMFYYYAMKDLVEDMPLFYKHQIEYLFNKLDVQNTYERHTEQLKEIFGECFDRLFGYEVKYDKL